MSNVKNNKIVKVIAAILCIAFLYQDIVWANPDMIAGSNSALQVPSKFVPINPEDLHCSLIDVYFGYLLGEIGRDKLADFDYRLTTSPIVRENGGLRLTLDLSKKIEEPSGASTIPCSVCDTTNASLYEYEIVVPRNGPYFLRKVVMRQKTNGPPSILEAAEMNIKKAAETMDLDSIFVDRDPTRADGLLESDLPQEAAPRNILLEPNRITSVEFKVRRDDGKDEIFYGFRVCQNDARGAGKGGLRWLIVKEETLEEAKETAAGLATFMSLKNSVVGIPLGGGKGDIVIPEGIKYSRDEQARIIRGFSRELTKKKAIGTFIDVPAPDQGTDAAMMAWFLDEHLKILAEEGSISNEEALTALKGVKADDAYPRRIYHLAEYACLLDGDEEGLLEGIELGMVTGKPVWSDDMGFRKNPDTKRPIWKSETGYDNGRNIRMGGSIGRTKATGFGGFLAFKATIDRLLRPENASLLESLDEKVQKTVRMAGENLKGKSVAMQGAGNVSEYDAWEFYKADAKIEILQDEHYTMLDPNGINFELLDNYLERKEGKKENIWRPLGEVKKEFLTSTGAKFVEYKDKDKKTGKDIILYNKNGLDLDELERCFPGDNEGNRKALADLSDIEMNDLLAATGCERRDVSILWTHRTDIKVAAATQNEITDDVAKIMDCDILLELANNPTTPGGDEILTGRGILVVPDILANVGGVTVSYFEWLQNIEGRYWSGVAVDKMLEERISAEADSVFRTATKYEVDLRRASLILALARLADAEIARSPELRKIFKDGNKRPYKFYGELGLNPETVEELESIYEDGKFAGLIDRSEAAQRSHVDKILERIDNEFARDRRGFVLISGSNTSGTLGFSERIEDGLKDKGRNAVKINIDLAIEDFEERFSGKSFLLDKSIDDIYKEKLKLILELVRSKTETKDSGNPIIILEGDYVLADEVLKLLEKEQKIRIFVNPVSSLKLKGNWPLTSLDLRFMRYILTFTSVYRKRAPLDVIRAWRKIRQSDLKYVYAAWKNADITFNSYLPYEAPVLKAYVEPILEEAFEKAKQEKDQVSVKSIGHLLDILDKIPVISGMERRIPDDSAIRQYIGKAAQGPQPTGQEKSSYKLPHDKMRSIEKIARCTDPEAITSEHIPKLAALCDDPHPSVRKYAKDMLRLMRVRLTMLLQVKSGPISEGATLPDSAQESRVSPDRMAPNAPVLAPKPEAPPDRIAQGARQLKYIYGPVKSRRLGRSLGVNVTLENSCTQNCPYCEVEGGSKVTDEMFHIDITKFEKEFREAIRKNPAVDYITIAGTGEPTLCENLGEVIEKIKEITHIRVCVITNSSLLDKPGVRRQLLKADLIISSLDAGTKETFEKINRPHRSINFDSMVSGLEQLRKEFTGNIWLEVMLVKDINDGEDEIIKLIELINRIEPDLVQVNSIDRPPREDVESPEDRKIAWFANEIRRGVGCHAEYFLKSDSGKGQEEAIKEKQAPASPEAAMDAAPAALESLPPQALASNIPENLAIVMQRLKDLFASGRYGKRVEIGSALSPKEYKQILEHLSKLSTEKPIDKKYLRELARINELSEMALLLSTAKDLKGNALWAGLDAFFNATLDLSQPTTRSKLFSKGAFPDQYPGAEMQELFREYHIRLYDVLRELIISGTDLTASGFSDMAEIGSSSLSGAPKFLFQYTRIAEIAGIVGAGFGMPKRFERNADPIKEGIADSPIMGIMFRMGPIQMHLLSGTKGRSDMAAVLSPVYEITYDPTIGKNVVMLKSGLYYSPRNGALTLAEFTQPVRLDYCAFHVKDKRLAEVAATGIPVPFSPDLAAVSGNKDLYPDFFKGSNLSFPVQTSWPLIETKKQGNERAAQSIRALLTRFMDEHQLQRIFIKPAKGSRGIGVEPFGRDAVDKAIAHIIALGDDAIIQSEIQKLDFRTLLQDSIDEGNVTGTVDSVLERIFERPVAPDAKIDWVIRSIISKDDKGVPVILASRIIANDKGVANTGQGGVMIEIEDYAPDLLMEIPNFSFINKEASRFGATRGESLSPDTDRPLDGISAHNADVTLIDTIVTPDKGIVIMEVDYGFVSNMWRADENRGEWTGFVVRRVMDRMRAYRKKLEELSARSSGYGNDKVKAVIEERKNDLHDAAAQRDIFAMLTQTYNPQTDEAVIAKRIYEARQKGEDVVVGIGGLGIAGIGPSILQAAAQKITDVTRIKERVEEFYSARTEDLPERIADASWKLYVYSKEDTLSVAQINGALAELKEAEDLYQAMRAAEIREKSRGETRKAELSALHRFLDSIDDAREDIAGLVKEAPKKNIFTVFAVQPLTSPPGHGYFIGLVNNGIFPHGITDGGLKALLPSAAPRLYATPSNKAIEHADTVIVTIRLDVEPEAPGRHKVDFGPIMKEVEDFSRPLAKGIENAKKEGRKPPTVVIVTTQGPGTSRMLIKALEDALQKVGKKAYTCGEDFYFVHAPSNIDPGKNWVNSLTKTPQPIGGINNASIEAGLRFFRAYSQTQKVYRGPQSLEQVELLKVFRNVAAANDIAGASMGSHAASLTGAVFSAIRDQIHEIAGMGMVRRLGDVPSHRVARAESGVGGPCLYKESEIIQALGPMGFAIFGHDETAFSRFLLQAADTSIVAFMRASRQLNEMQPYYVAGLAFGALEKANISAEEAEVVLAGIAYKRDMGGDTRHTPAYDILMGLLADPLHLRSMPPNFNAGYDYLASHGTPNITMVDPDVSYFREVDQRANKVPDIRELAAADDEAIDKIPSLAAQAKSFLKAHKTKLPEVEDAARLRSLDSRADAELVDYIADFFFLNNGGRDRRAQWQKLASSKIQHDLWKAVIGKDLLILSQGHKAFKGCIDDLPKLAGVMRSKVIVDAVNFMNDEKIKQWQALGGVYFGVGKANPYIDFLAQTVRKQSEIASRILDAKRKRDLSAMAQALNSVKQELSLDALLNLKGSLSVRKIGLKLYRGMTAEELDWDTWYYFCGGKYLLMGKEAAEIEAAKAPFLEKATGSGKTEPSTNSLKILEALKEELFAKIDNSSYYRASSPKKQLAEYEKFVTSLGIPVQVNTADLGIIEFNYMRLDIIWKNLMGFIRNIKETNFRSAFWSLTIVICSVFQILTQWGFPYARFWYSAKDDSIENVRINTKNILYLSTFISVPITYAVIWRGNITLIIMCSITAWLTMFLFSRSMNRKQRGLGHELTHVVQQDFIWRIWNTLNLPYSLNAFTAMIEQEQKILLSDIPSPEKLKDVINDIVRQVTTIVQKREDGPDGTTLPDSAQESRVSPDRTAPDEVTTTARRAADQGSSQLIGKYVPTTPVEFIETSSGTGEGYIQFKAYRINDLTQADIEIKINAKMAPPGLFNNFRRTDIPEIDTQLEAFLDSFKGDTFILEPNQYGIDGIGTENILAISNPLQNYTIALFHELAHAANIDVMPYIKGGETALNEYIYKEGKAHRQLPLMRQHYALRLFQSQKWPKYDLALTKRIKEIEKEYEDSVKAAASPIELSPPETIGFDILLARQGITVELIQTMDPYSGNYRKLIARTADLVRAHNLQRQLQRRVEKTHSAERIVESLIGWFIPMLRWVKPGRIKKPNEALDEFMYEVWGHIQLELGRRDFFKRAAFTMFALGKMMSLNPAEAVSAVSRMIAQPASQMKTGFDEEIARLSFGDAVSFVNLHAMFLPQLAHNMDRQQLYERYPGMRTAPYIVSVVERFFNPATSRDLFRKEVSGWMRNDPAAIERYYNKLAGWRGLYEEVLTEVTNAEFLHDYSKDLSALSRFTDFIPWARDVLFPMLPATSELVGAQSGFAAARSARSAAAIKPQISKYFSYLAKENDVLIRVPLSETGEAISMAVECDGVLEESAVLWTDSVKELLEKYPLCAKGEKHIEISIPKGAILEQVEHFYLGAFKIAHTENAINELSHRLSERINHLNADNVTKDDIDKDSKVVELRAELERLYAQLEDLNRFYLLNRPGAFFGEGGGAEHARRILLNRIDVSRWVRARTTVYGGVEHTLISITVPKGLDINEQAMCLVSLINRALREKGLRKSDVIKQVIFIDNFSHRASCDKILRDQFYRNTLPATSFVQQPPIEGGILAAEITVVKGDDVAVRRISDQITVVEHGGLRWAYAAGIEPDESIQGPYEQVLNALGKMKAILESNGFSFREVVRTWFYERDMLRFEPDGSQRYQLLNEARKHFYNTADGGKPIVFNKALPPASTGIGMSGGNFVLECLALSGSMNGLEVTPLENPEQASAYTYGGEVSQEAAGAKEKAPPLFSRGMAVALGGHSMILVSGTASIKGPVTVHEGDVVKQTETAIENIGLVLKQAGASLKDIPQLRVYVKRPEDYHKVKEVVDKIFSDTPCLYLIADVCRDNLLVEIEAIAYTAEATAAAEGGQPADEGRRFSAITQESPVIDTHTPMFTRIFMDPVSKKLLKNNEWVDLTEGEPRIIDFGCGFMPETTAKFSKALQDINPRAKVLGIDIALPKTLVVDADGVRGLFDEKGELAMVINPEQEAMVYGRYVYDRRGLESYHHLKILKGSLTRMIPKGQRRYRSPHGDEIIIDPYEDMRESDNLSFERKGFAYLKTLPPASTRVILMMGVLYYYQDEAPAIVREFIEPAIEEGGIFIDGYAPDHGIDMGYIVVSKKINGTLVVTNNIRWDKEIVAGLSTKYPFAHQIGHVIQDAPKGRAPGIHIPAPDKEGAGETSLNVLQNLREKETPFEDFETALKVFKGGRISWKRTTPDIQRRFVEMLADSLGKKPGKLTIGDFSRKIEEFGDKTLSSLLSYYYRQKNQGHSNEGVIDLIKKALGIEAATAKTKLPETTKDWKRVCEIITRYEKISIAEYEVEPWLEKNILTQEIIAELARDAKAGNSAAGDAICITSLSKVDNIVKYFHNRNHDIEKEAFVEVGIEALRRCITRYDPDKGVPFYAYSLRRVRGSMQDLVRARRGYRRKGRITEIITGLIESMPDNKNSSMEILGGLELSQKGPEEIRRILKGKMSGRNIEIFILRAIEGEKERDIARRFNVCPSRISQILKRCRESIEKEIHRSEQAVNRSGSSCMVRKPQSELSPDSLQPGSGVVGIGTLLGMPINELILYFNVPTEPHHLGQFLPVLFSLSEERLRKEGGLLVKEVTFTDAPGLKAFSQRFVERYLALDTAIKSDAARRIAVTALALSGMARENSDEYLNAFLLAINPANPNAPPENILDERFLSAITDHFAAIGPAAYRENLLNNKTRLVIKAQRIINELRSSGDERPKKRPPDEQTLREALIRHDWKIGAAAAAIGLEKSYFWRLLKKHGITKEYLRERRGAYILGILEIFLWDVDEAAHYLHMDRSSLYRFIRERGITISEAKRQAEEAVNKDVVSEDDITRHPEALELLGERTHEEPKGSFDRELLIKMVEEILSSRVLNKRQELIMRLRFGVFGDTFPEEILQKIREHVETRNKRSVPEEPYAFLSYRFVAEILGDMGYERVTATRIQQLEQKAIHKLSEKPSRRKILGELIGLTREPAQVSVVRPGGIRLASGSAGKIFRPGGRIWDRESLRKNMEKLAKEASGAFASSRAAPAPAEPKILSLKDVSPSTVEEKLGLDAAYRPVSEELKISPLEERDISIGRRSPGLDRKIDALDRKTLEKLCGYYEGIPLEEIKTSDRDRMLAGELYFKRGQVLYRQRRHEKAIRYLEDADILIPDHKYVPYYLGISLFKTAHGEHRNGRNLSDADRMRYYLRSAEELRRHLKIFPDRINLRHEVAEALKKAGQLSQARKECEEILAIIGEYLDAIRKGERSGIKRGVLEDTRRSTLNCLGYILLQSARSAGEDHEKLSLLNAAHQSFISCLEAIKGEAPEILSQRNRVWLGIMNTSEHFIQFYFERGDYGLAAVYFERMFTHYAYLIEADSHKDEGSRLRWLNMATCIKRVTSHFKEALTKIETAGQVEQLRRCLNNIPDNIPGNNFKRLREELSGLLEERLGSSPLLSEKYPHGDPRNIPIIMGGWPKYEPSVKGKKIRGTSKWKLLDILKEQVKALPDEVVQRLKETKNLGERRNVLIKHGIEVAGEIDGKFLNDAIEKLTAPPDVTEAQVSAKKRFRRGGSGRHLVSYLSEKLDYVIKTYFDKTNKRLVQSEWIESGYEIARQRLEGLATRTLIIDATNGKKKDFVFMLEDGNRISTDVAIIQEKVVPLLDYLKMLERAGKISEAKSKIDEYKAFLLKMFRRGVVDVDFGGTLANYGVSEKTNKMYIYDFGDLSTGIAYAYDYTDGIETINEYIKNGLRLVSDELADYFRDNPFKESDFYSGEQEASYLFGADFNEGNKKEFLMRFDYSEEEIRKMFSENKVKKYPKDPREDIPMLMGGWPRVTLGGVTPVEIIIGSQGGLLGEGKLAFHSLGIKQLRLIQGPSKNIFYIGDGLDALDGEGACKVSAICVDVKNQVVLAKYGRIGAHDELIKSYNEAYENLHAEDDDIVRFAYFPGHGSSSVDGILFVTSYIGSKAQRNRDKVMEAVDVLHEIGLSRDKKVDNIPDAEKNESETAAMPQATGEAKATTGGEKTETATLLSAIWKKALYETAETLGVKESDVLEGLKSINKESHRIFRYNLAKTISDELAKFSGEVLRVWIFGDIGEGSINNIRPTSDIDFIIEVTSSEGRDRVQRLLEDINIHVTAEYNNAMAGTNTKMEELIELSNVKRIFLPEEIARREGASFRVASIDNPASIIYERADRGAADRGAILQGDTLRSSDEASWGPFLRNMTEPEPLVKSFVEKILSMLLTKKVVLVFDNGLKDKKAIGVFEMVKYLKTKPIFKRLLTNLHIIVCGPDRIRFKVQEYLGDEKAEVFVFARRAHNGDMKELEGSSAVHPCYIDDTEFDETTNDYYPLLEIVTLTLAEYIDSAALDNVKELVKELGVEFMEREGRALIFKILPKPGPHDYQALIKRYALLKELLRSA